LLRDHKGSGIFNGKTRTKICFKIKEQ